MKAFEKIELCKNELAEKYTKIIHTEFPKRTGDYSKCKRDMLLIIDSYIDVLRYKDETRRENYFNTTDLISHRFFGSNYKQLKGDVSVEINIHQRLYTDLDGIIVDHTEDRAILKQCAVQLMDKFSNGVETYEENYIVNLLKDRYQCRAFSKRPVELEKVRILLDALEQTPAKQCIQPIRVDVLGPKALRDKEFIYTDTVCTLKPSQMNPQVFSPLTFVFSNRTDFNEITEEEKKGVPELNWENPCHDKGRFMAIGMSVAILTLTAKSLGLEVGFVAAIGPGRYTKEVLNQKNMTDFVLGIGYPREDFDYPRTRLEPDKDKNQYQGAIIKYSDRKQSSFSDWIHLRGF